MYKSMKQPILIIQQTEHEPPGMIADIILDSGWQYETLMAQQTSIPQAMRNFSGLIIMGGHMSANDTHLEFIDRQIRLLRWCMHFNFPVLGICLGAQLLAKAAGAEILPSPVRELGWYPLHPTFLIQDDPLFSELLPSGKYIFQWHGETFTLPERSVLLATCPEVVNQAFRISDKQYGLQFHAEVTEPMIRDWVECGTSESAYLGETGVAQLLNNIPSHLPVARDFCRDLISSWLKLL